MIAVDRKLPDGYALEQDDDGDWILFPPADVTILSAPGDGLLIGKCDRKTAMSDALDYLGVAPWLTEYEVVKGRNDG